MCTPLAQIEKKRTQLNKIVFSISTLSSHSFNLI